MCCISSKSSWSLFVPNISRTKFQLTLAIHVLPCYCCALSLQWEFSVQLDLQYFKLNYFKKSSLVVIYFEKWVWLIKFTNVWCVCLKHSLHVVCTPVNINDIYLVSTVIMWLHINWCISGTLIIYHSYHWDNLPIPVVILVCKFNTLL